MSQELPKPTPAETEILSILWDLGPATVRQVHDRLNEQRQNGYTTVLKMMQLMAEKGLLSRVEGESRAHVYQPAVDRSTTQRQMIRDVVDRVFGGNPSQLVLQALAELPATPEELAEIRRLIEQREKGASA